MGTIKMYFFGKSLQALEEFKHIKHIKTYSGVNGHIKECFCDHGSEESHDFVSGVFSS